MDGIKTAEALTAALAKCSGGEHLFVTEKLPAFAIWNRHWDRPVTIECVERGQFDMVETPETLGHGGAWNSAVMLVNVAGLILKNIVATGWKLPNPDYGDPAKVGTSRFDYRGGGLGVDSIKNVLVDGGFFGDAGVGIGGQNARDFVIQDARIAGSNFGIQIGGGGDPRTGTPSTDGLHILRNRVTDFDINAHRGDHPDCIMVFTSPPWGDDIGPTMCPRNVKIIGNLCGASGPDIPQGIFLRDAGGSFLMSGQTTWPNMPKEQRFEFENIEIRGNTVLHGMWNHISWERVKPEGFIVVDNKVFHVDIDPNDYPGHPYHKAPYGPVTQARIAGDRLPGVMEGNHAHFYLIRDAGWNVVPPGNSRTDSISPEEAEAIIARWCAANKAGTIPRPGEAPTPAPAPAPAPSPSPSPAPAPAPAPIGDRAARARVLAQQARDEVNLAENTLGRALRRLDNIDRALDELLK